MVNNAPATRASVKASFDFGAEYRKFLSDPENIAMMREALLGPVMDELRSARSLLREKETIIEGLEQKVDQLEQYTRRNSLRISGLPEEEDEDCYEKVLSTLNTKLSLSPPLSIDHIDCLHRTGKSHPNKPRQVIVKFTSYQHRRRVMAQRRQLRGTNLYVNEDLTRKRNALYWSARNAKRQQRIRDAWTYDGRVMIKTHSGHTHEIHHEHDIQTHQTTQPQIPATPHSPTPPPHS